MITSIRLEIIPDGALPESTLARFIELAKERGTSPEEMLSKMITSEIEASQADEREFDKVNPEGQN